MCTLYPLQFLQQLIISTLLPVRLRGIIATTEDMPGIIPFPAACIGITHWQRVVAPEFLLYLLQKRCLAVARIACQENSGGARCQKCREEMFLPRWFHIG